jgi:hypothetical protein
LADGILWAVLVAGAIFLMSLNLVGRTVQPFQAPPAPEPVAEPDGIFGDGRIVAIRGESWLECGAAFGNELRIPRTDIVGLTICLRQIRIREGDKPKWADCLEIRTSTGEVRTLFNTGEASRAWIAGEIGRELGLPVPDRRPG